MLLEKKMLWGEGEYTFMKASRLAVFISLCAMVLIWMFAIGLLGYALREWKDTWQHTIVHLLAVVTLVNLCVLIPVQIIRSIRSEVDNETGERS